MIRAVLIDDEELALDLLDIMLKEIGGVTVVGKFSRAAEALHEMARLEADLVFLDIEMPGMNGLAAAERLLSANPRMTIVFVTAYQHYAIDAFDLEAMDYLLKPISSSRLLKALDRFHKKREPHRRDVASEETELVPADKDVSICLRLNVLGSLELYDAGHNLVSWRTRKVKELFAYRYPNAISFADERYVMRTDFIQSDAGTLNEIYTKTGTVLVKNGSPCTGAICWKRRTIRGRRRCACSFGRITCGFLSRTLTLRPARSRKRSGES
ncbi:MAG: yehT 2 [Paenibacillus sp.]|nr:yehT 2 [Paenibacillus sp.]